MDTIMFKRGDKKDLPKSAHLGEPLLCKDTRALYVGMGDGEDIKPVRTEGEMKNSELITELSGLIKDLGVSLNDLEEVLVSRINKVEENILYMPLPSTVEENTRIFQKYLDIAKNSQRDIEIRFKAGTYNLYTCVMHSNTTIKLGEYTTLNHIRKAWYNPEKDANVTMNIFLTNAKPFDEETGCITGYNGSSNINFMGGGGVIKAYCPFLLAHGKDILMDRINFEETKTDHIMQIGACKNVKIRDCAFRGITAPSSDRGYVEMVQIDSMFYAGQPYWTSDSATYDNTINDNIIIERCSFGKGTGAFANFRTAIGSHGSVVNKNKNIVIRNCDFENYEYAGVHPLGMDGVYIEGCRFTTDTSVPALVIADVTHIYTNDLKVNGGSRLLYGSGIQDLKMHRVSVENLSEVDSYMVLGETNVANMSDISFSNCKEATYGVLIRNCSNILMRGVIDNNNIITGKGFVRVATKNDGVCDRITIKDISTSLIPVVATNTTNLIDGHTKEYLFKGSATEGILNLSDALENFDNVKISLSYYGNVDIDLVFYGDRFIFREINLPDNSSEHTGVQLIEGSLSRIDDLHINIDYMNQILLNNGTLTPVDSKAMVIQIYGLRKSFKDKEEKLTA